MVPRKSPFAPMDGARGFFYGKAARKPERQGAEKERRSSDEKNGVLRKIREQHMGTCQQAAGWVQKKRDMGGVIFLDLKDREGVLQVVCDASLLGEQFAAAERVHLQSVVQVSGRIRRRSEETYNPRLATGTVELAAEQLEVLSEAGSLPFSMEEDAAVREDLRLQYRYLDLRRSRMYRNLRFRHAVHEGGAGLSGCGWLFVRRDAHAAPNPPPRARATIWCPAVCTPAAFMHCRSRRRFSSSC